MAFINLLHWTTASGFFISMFVFMSLLVLIIVASWIILIIRTSLLSFHICTISSPFLLNADCPLFKHWSSPSMSHRMPLLALTVPQTLTFLSSNVWANLCYKNCLDRCYDFSLSFCLEVITLFSPTSFPQLSVSPCCRHNLIPPHTTFSPALHIMLFSLDCTSYISGNPAMG